MCDDCGRLYIEIRWLIAVFYYGYTELRDLRLLLSSAINNRIGRVRVEYKINYSKLITEELREPLVISQCINPSVWLYLMNFFGGHTRLTQLKLTKILRELHASNLGTQNLSLHGMRVTYGKSVAFRGDYRSYSNSI